MSRQLIAAGNWKMNKDFEEGLQLVRDINGGTTDGKAKVVLATPAIHLKAAAAIVANNDTVSIAAQNCHQAASGAYTGELSVSMIKSTGAEYIIIGHSERREYFKEGDALLAEKVNAVLAADLTPIFCCGESLAIREAGTHVEYVGKQLKNGLFHLSAEDFDKVVIAYEPIWAIGTGVTASPQQAQDIQQALRQLIAKKYGAAAADATTILYGGSVKPANAKELFGQPDVDGGLVGGASLNAEGFLAIINSFS